MERVLVTGYGTWTAAGVGCDAFAAAIDQRRPALTAWGERAAECKAELAGLSAGLIADLSPFRSLFPEIKPPLPAPLSQIAMVAAREALHHAGLRDTATREQVGAIFNRNRGPASIVARSMLPVMQHGPKKMSPLLFSQAVANAPLGALTVALGLKGPNLLTMGGGALQVAFDELKHGHSSATLCGGMDEVEAHSFVAAHKNGFIGQATLEQPQQRATFGEGAAAFLLETASSARLRGAPPLAEVLSVEQGLDAHASEPEDLRGWGNVSRAGLVAVCEAALAAGGVSANELDFYCGGANGDPALEGAQAGLLHHLGRPELSTQTPRLHLLFGDGYGMALYLGLAWCVLQLQRAANERNGLRHALLTHTDFHGQHSAVVLRSFPL
jgi:3-oxoacyl-(acyl-carrier-protein) synthase